MKTALDSSVILDLLTDDPQWGQASEESLKRTLGSGPLVLPDFLIGPHAACHTSRLLARDRRYYRDYFTNLTVIEPTIKKNA